MQGIAEALSRVADRDGKTPDDILELLLQLLKSNDNSMNRVRIHC